MAQKKTSTTEPKRDTQVRFRVYRAEDEHLSKAAADAGFSDKSAYLRAVLLAKHVVVVKGNGIVLVPAATASKEAQQVVSDLLIEILEQLTAEELIDRQVAEGPSQVAGNIASGPPDSTPAAALGADGVDGAPAGDSEGMGVAHEASGGADTAPSPSPETSPGEGDGLLGSVSSQEPPAAPGLESPGSSADIAAAGAIPGPEETTPEPTAEQLADEAAADHDVDLSDVALGPEIQPGETQQAYLERRTIELKFQGRPVVIARYEAEAEYRRYATAALAGAVAPAGSGPVEQPTPGPVACGNCGALKRSPGLCPDCGAPA